MMRPPRGKRRFQGEGRTSLSNPTYNEADGSRMRRRYAMFAAACVLVIAGIIALAVTGGGGGDSSNSSSVSGGKENSSGKGSSSQSSPGYKILSDTTYEDSKKDSIPSNINAQVQTRKHIKSGMQVMSMVPEDTTQDATFGISFRTLPENQRGAAKVVQEILKTGSVNYPVKDPFNQLKRGSLSTYLDSWIDKDRTGFVVSSRNKQDYENAINVILDSVLHPLLPEEEHDWAFRQEGWRLELENNEILYLSGNAINEVKAAQMRPDHAMDTVVYERLFPGHTYGFSEVGLHQDIVSLTHQQLINFYNKYYVPANGHAFCYGPQNFVDVCLGLLDDHLNDFTADRLGRDSSRVAWQELDKVEPPRDSVPYPSYENTGDFRLISAYVLNDQPLDVRTELAWRLIFDLLVGSPTAKLSAHIAGLKLGDDVIARLDRSLQQWVLILGCSGIPSADKVEKTEVLVQKNLEEVASTGFNTDALKSALAKMEMELRDPSSGAVPQGVKVFRDSLEYWNYEIDPKTPFTRMEVFVKLKSELLGEDGQRFLMDLVTHRILDNQRKVTLELVPSTDLQQLYEGQERTWLDTLDNQVSKEEGLQILRETADLHRKQNSEDSEDALKTIPRVSVSDLGKETQEIPIQVEKDIFDSGVTKLEHELRSTNGMVYVDFAMDMSNLDFDDISLIPFLCEMMRISGTKSTSDVFFQRKLDLHTRSFSVVPLIDEVFNSDNGYVVADGKHMISKIVARSSCIAETGCGGMFGLIVDALFFADLEDHATTLATLQRMIDDMEDDIQVNGHKYTTLRIASRYSLPGFVDEQWKGISHLMSLRQSLDAAINDWGSFSSRLLAMRDAITNGNRNGTFLSITGGQQAIKDISGGVKNFATNQLPAASQTPKFADFATEEHPWVVKGMQRMSEVVKSEGTNEAFIVPTMVNHVGKGGILYDVGEPIRGSDSVVMQYLGGYYLYDKVRFGLGAKQAWAVLDVDSGSVIFQSDRDPAIMETLDVYEKGATWIHEQTSGMSELPVEAEASVVGAIGRFDGTAYQPSEAGFVSMIRYLRHDTPEARKKFRDEILATSTADCSAMVDRLGAWYKPVVSVVTSQAEYEQAQSAGLEMTTCDITGLQC